MKNVLIILLFVLLVSVKAQGAANYTLEIIQPQPSLDTKNRFYKAYTGLEYNVRLAVIGGDYPFTYSLTTSPSGMTINTATGEIIWSNPVEAGSPHSVTAEVTDLESSTDNVSWTITVTTSGFRFLDSVNGTTVAGGGTGTLANPWKNMDDMYEGSDQAAKTKDSYAFEFLYFRTGTYNTGDAYIEDPVGDGTGRMPLTGFDKPLVWMAYPGESPILNLTEAYIIIYSGVANAYFDGFEITNMINFFRKGVSISPGNNVTFRRNTFHNLTTGGVGGSNNQSCIMRTNDTFKGNYFSVQDNTFYDIRKGYAVISYDINKALVEDNVLHDFSDGNPGIGPKENNTMWFIRANTMYNMANTRCIWLNNTPTSVDMEVSYNLVNDVGFAALHVNQGNPNNGAIAYIFRNTFVGRVMFLNVESDDGQFFFSDNVVVNEDSPVVTITGGSPSRVVQTDNLVGDAADAIVDANGNLISPYLSYLGTTGYQILAEDGITSTFSSFTGTFQ